jgi:hypothetical protein
MRGIQKPFVPSLGGERRVGRKEGREGREREGGRRQGRRQEPGRQMLLPMVENQQC